MGTSDQSTPLILFRGGTDLTPRLGVDVLLDQATGLLRTDRGISLYSDPALVERFGETWQVIFVPEGLKTEQRGRDSRHYELMAAVPMTFEAYIELLAQVVLARHQKKGV